VRAHAISITDLYRFAIRTWPHPAAAGAAGVLQGRDQASTQLHRDLARVNPVALVFDGRLGGDVDRRFAEYLRRSVFDVEDALVSLVGVVVALSAERFA
jgi:hypothetical protein